MVGAGPWGSMTAWRAAAAGARVALIDDGDAPAGSVAAGMLGPWAEAEEGAHAMHLAMRRALDAWPAAAGAIADAGGRDAGYRRSGSVLVASRPEHVGAVRRRLAVLGSWGESFAWVGGGTVREIEPGLGPAVTGGVDMPDEHQVEPRALLGALSAACAACGVRMVTGSAAALTGRPVDGVRLEGGTRIRAGRVVLAAGRAAARLARRAAIRPVKGQILRLRATPRAPIPIERMVRTPSVYLAPRDGELVVGATSEERTDRRVSAVAVAHLLREALRAVPEVAELELAEASAGLRPAAPDGLPVVGLDGDDGLVWATGGYRHGILLAPIAAEAAVAAASGVPVPDWALPWSPERFPACG